MAYRYDTRAPGPSYDYDDRGGQQGQAYDYGQSSYYLNNQQRQDQEQQYASDYYGGHAYPPSQLPSREPTPYRRGHTDSRDEPMTLDEEYQAAAEKGLRPGATARDSRASLAAQRAAEGSISKSEGLKMWRSEERSGALMRGGRGKCCLRVCCCSIILALILVVGIIAAFFLWVRPPNVQFYGVSLPSGSNGVTLSSSGFNLGFNVRIGVINPNFFGADFRRIDATAFYSTAPDTQIGGGNLTNVQIPKNSNTTITFPFTVTYSTSIDPDLSILRSIAGNCGFLSGSTASDLTFDYTVKVQVHVIAITISPSFSSSASFACPLDREDLENIVGSGGLGSLGLGSSRLMARGERAATKWTREMDDEAKRAMQKIMHRAGQVIEDDWRTGRAQAKRRP